LRQTLQHAVNIFFSVVGADDDAEHNNFVECLQGAKIVYFCPP